MTPLCKAEMLENLKAMLQDLFRLRKAGGAHARVARAQGYVDGYMRLLLDAGMVEKDELLSLVVLERTREDGPPTGQLESEVAA